MSESKLNGQIAARRLRAQRIESSPLRDAAAVVAWLGAVQAQEYAYAKWALALRMGEGTADSDIEKAFDDGRILRTHVMRPTWHFVAAEDIVWMLELTAARVHQMLAAYCRQFELDVAVMVRSARVFERALGNGRCLTRSELQVALARAGIQAQGVRLALMTEYAELERIMCSGPRRGKQFTYALLSDRAPAPRRFARDEALAELGRRFFRSHAPATIRDFVWWSGLTTADAKRSVQMIGASQETIDGLNYWTVDDSPAVDMKRAGNIHLLPIYDEYLVAYRDREAVPMPGSFAPTGGGLMRIQNTVVKTGQVVGTWKNGSNGSELSVQLMNAKRVARQDRMALSDSVERYSRFLGVPLKMFLSV
jgi:winged helix DNA-binding protein